MIVTIVLKCSGVRFVWWKASLLKCSVACLYVYGCVGMRFKMCCEFRVEYVKDDCYNCLEMFRWKVCLVEGKSAVPCSCVFGLFVIVCLLQR